MRTYFDSKEIAHVWAHQNAPHGNCRASMRFNGPSFYSYGTEIARIIEHKGKTAFILNMTGYSSTTSGHQSLVRQAIPDCNATVFHVGDIRRGDDLGRVKPSALFDYAVHQAAESGNKAERARTNKGYYLLEQSNWLKEAQKVNEFFGLRRKVDDAAVKRVGKRLASERRKQTILEKKAEAKRFEAAKEKIEAWLRGDDVDFPYGIHRVYFRAIRDVVDHPGEPYMETSLGVRVPLADAKLAYQFAMIVRNKKKDWRRNGERCPIGDYQLDAINKTGIVAGCHHVIWEEIDRFAKLMGWDK